KLYVAILMAAASFTASASDQDVTITNGHTATFSATSNLFSTNGSDTINFYGLAAGQYEVLLSYSGVLTKITAASLNGFDPEEISTGKRSSSGFFDISAGSPFVLKLWGSVTGDPTLALYGGNISVKAVPEPETYGMLLGGLAMLGMVSRRKAKKSA
ncbi:FxDxF family PEP-CTERM protein, partial [Undibacterium sp.]|uniref:FxDxF family PEP-CTERM protein n=1 Tax=Undibacterium sp. TaxID=1914977 RepID=UPI00374CD58F